MAAQKKGINFLLKSQLEETEIGKFFKWAFGFGKYIVILTELVVIAAFLFRFKLDQDLNRLREEISQKQNIIASLGILENNVRIAQKQLEVIKKELQNQPQLYGSLIEFSSIIPKDTFLQELSFSKNSVSFTGKSPAEASFATLISEMQKSKVFTDIIVNSISSGGVRDPSIVFKIKAELQPKE